MITVAPETPSAAAHRLASGMLRRGFDDVALHTYTTADGSPLFWRIRVKNRRTGEKWIRPMKREGQGYVLGEPSLAPSAGKPLYRLHELTRRPGEIVLVTEGEQKADRLHALGLLATTSGAADSAAAADWRPLTSRQVLLWPDHDEPGERYALAVASALTPLQSDVRIIDTSALGLEPKGDAVNWLDLHPQATAADVLALVTVDVPIAPDHATTTSIHPGDSNSKPNICAYGRGQFELAERGVLYSSKADESGNRPQWVCAPLGVIAKTRDVRSGEWGRLLEWFDDDAVRHQWAVPMELLEGDGLDLRRELARQGLQIAASKTGRELLLAYIKAWPATDRVRCVDRLGWHGPLYITPSQTFGATKERVVFQNSPSVEPAMTIAGSTKDWRDHVARLASGNSRLVFAIAVALAAPLADVMGEDSGGFHLRGRSSSGKSTALKVAASVWGSPRTFVRLWRATANGLEGLAAVHNDGVLILDELSQCDPKEAGEAAYLLANGQGKTRASRNGSARAAHRWRILFLSAGEESLSALMARAGHKAKAGQEIRLADIHADAQAGAGIVEELHDASDAAELVERISDGAHHCHGAVGVEWLQHVVRDRAQLAQSLVDQMRDFVASVVPADASGQVHRVARRFALVSMAGELAIHYGLTGWTVGESQWAARACFASWLEGFGGADNHEERNMLAQVRRFFELHGASRFEDMASPQEQRIVNRAGFFRQGIQGAREFLVLPEAYRNDVCAGLDVKATTHALLARGWIAPGSDGRMTQKPRLPGLGTASRVYVFTPRMWEDES